MLAEPLLSFAPIAVVGTILELIGNTPLLVPGVAIAVIVGVGLAPAVATRTGLSPLLAGMLVFAIGAIVAITLTPGSGAGFFGRSWCGGLFPAPRPGQLISLSSEHGLNVALFVPLGILIGLIPRARPFAIVAIAALAMPIVIEWIQYSVPRLDRICQTWDALENLIGLAIGLGIGVTIAVVRRSIRRAA
ncbi:MAG: VanZ family protein [Candidatus Limnocylindrales bacterium]